MGKTDPKAFEEIGYEAGRAFAALFDGFLRGVEDCRAGLDDGGGVEFVEDKPEPPPQEGEENVCRACWCDTCAKIDECDAFPPVDGIRPPPCAECEAKNAAPIMPRSKPAECGTYERVPKDCRACWCHGCANFEDCVVEKAGYDPSSKPCPCDGCSKGERYMPKEEPPTCGKYAAGGRGSKG